MALARSSRSPSQPAQPVRASTRSPPAACPARSAATGCTLAFVLLPFGLLALHAGLAWAPADGRSLGALVSSLAGIALVLPMLGVETYVLPVLGTLHQGGQRGVAPAIGMIYLGPALWAFLLGLVLLAAGAIAFAVAIWRTAVLPRWAGVLLAVGLALWFPPFPRAIRVADGLVIGAAACGSPRASGVRPRRRRRPDDRAEERPRAATVRPRRRPGGDGARLYFVSVFGLSSATASA